MSTPEVELEQKAAPSGVKNFYQKNKNMILAVLAVLVLLAIGYYILYYTELLGGSEESEKSVDESASVEGLGRGVKIQSA